MLAISLDEEIFSKVSARLPSCALTAVLGISPRLLRLIRDFLLIFLPARRDLPLLEMFVIVRVAITTSYSK